MSLSIVSLKKKKNVSLLEWVDKQLFQGADWVLNPNILSIHPFADTSEGQKDHPLLQKKKKGGGGGVVGAMKIWCLMSTETISLIRDGEKGAGEGMEVGEEGDYIPIAALSPTE